MKFIIEHVSNDTYRLTKLDKLSNVIDIFEGPLRYMLVRILTSFVYDTKLGIRKVRK